MPTQTVKEYNEKMLATTGLNHKQVAELIGYDNTTFSRCFVGSMAMTNKFLKGMVQEIPGYDPAHVLHLQSQAQLAACGLLKETEVCQS